MKQLKKKVRNKIVSIEEEKADNDSIINSMPDHFYQVPGVHLSLKQNLHFFMRKKEVNPMGSTFILLGHVSHRPNNLYIVSSFSFCSLVRHSISYIDIDD